MKYPGQDAVIHGRGASYNPPNRFVAEHTEIDVDCSDLPDDERPQPQTKYYRDASESIIAYNDSPDVGFTASINPYRGCLHGCAYCYARPFHEYLGFSAGLDFETKIMVKENAPALLRRELASPKWKPQTIAMSGVTDCYQPIERKLKLTRGCLEVLAECRNPAGIITKNHVVVRDIDVLSELARYNCIMVYFSITTLDPELARVMEPRTATPTARLAAMRKLAEAGIPTGALLAPIVPGLTDSEIPALVKAAAESGARTAHFLPLRLPGAVQELFVSWLEQHFPLRKEKVIAQIRSVKGGRLNDPRFNSRMRGSGIMAEAMHKMFAVAYRKAGFKESGELSTEHFRRPSGKQIQLELAGN